MLTKRLIARLDIKSPNLIKQIRMEGVRVIGSPGAYARRYNAQGIDEIIYMDAVASLYGRNALEGLVSETAKDVFCPITVGGGVRSVEDAARLLRAGADKISLNTEATKRPGLITELAEKFGSQCIVIQIDAKHFGGLGWMAWRDGGRENTGMPVEAWAERAVELGAGEILLTSIDQEGTGQGFDGPLIGAVCLKSRVPVIVSGGMGKAEDAVTAFNIGADAVAMAHCLHYGTVPLSETRAAVQAAGHPVRVAA